LRTDTRTSHQQNRKQENERKRAESLHSRISFLRGNNTMRQLRPGLPPINNDIEIHLPEFWFTPAKMEI